MVDLLTFLHGRWSKVPPTRAGLYFMRIGTAMPAHVGQWNPEAPEDAEGPSVSSEHTHRGEWEFFHLVGDPDGEPTPADDPRAVREALANGWRPFRSASDRPPPTPREGADSYGVKPPDAWRA